MNKYKLINLLELYRISDRDLLTADDEIEII